MPRPHKTPWQALQKTYERKGVVLVLGAGVSVGSGVPSWDELLERLAQKTRAGHGVLEQLRSRGFPQTAIASAMEQLWGSRSAFIAEVRKVLYSSIPLDRKRDAASEADFVSHLCERNTTLRAVAALCCLSKKGYLPNPRVRCVVSFNLDSLLETFTEMRYGRYFMRAIDHAAVSSRPRSISTPRTRIYPALWLAPGHGSASQYSPH